MDAVRWRGNSTPLSRRGYPGTIALHNDIRKRSSSKLPNSIPSVASRSAEHVIQQCYFNMLYVMADLQCPLLIHSVYRFVPRPRVLHAGSPLGPSHLPMQIAGAKALVDGQIVCAYTAVYAGDRDPPQNPLHYHSYRWQWQTCVSRSITLHSRGKALGIYYRQDCAEKTIYALKICQGGACDVMLVGEGDLPRSGASRCIQGRAYADLDGSLRRLCAANAARLERERQGEQSACGLPDDPNQVCVVAWATIKEGSAGALISHDDNMACEGVTASSRFWSSQRACCSRRSPSLTLG